MTTTDKLLSWIFDGGGLAMGASSLTVAWLVAEAVEWVRTFNRRRDGNRV